MFVQGRADRCSRGVQPCSYGGDDGRGSEQAQTGGIQRDAGCADAATGSQSRRGRGAGDRVAVGVV